ncbi:MAG: DUF6580 family putative transport protein [Thermaurantimonas sp.]
MTRKDWLYTLILFIVAVASRLIPHYPNFTAIGSIAVVGGLVIKNRFPALIATLTSLYMSDLLINNILLHDYYESFTWFTPGGGLIYGCFAFSVFIPRMLPFKNNILKWVTASLGSTLVFYLVTNFGVWYQSTLYSQDLSGLLACYVAAIPFAINQLLGTLFYGALLLASFSVVNRHVVEVA